MKAKKKPKPLKLELCEPFVHRAKDDRRYLRQVEFDGYCLRTWDAHKRDTTHWHRPYVGYELINPQGQRLFHGDDFSPGISHCLDATATLRDLVFFLTLAPGETDQEHFADYTSEQMAFARSGAAEELRLWADEENDVVPRNFAGEPDIYAKFVSGFHFTNIDDWEDE